MDEALRQGAQSARVELMCYSDLTVQCQNTEITTLQQNNGCGMILRLFVDGKYGTYSTNRLEKKELEALISSGIACTRLLTPDPDRVLPDPARYYKASSFEQNQQEVLALGNYIPENPDINPVALACNIARPILGTDQRLMHLSTYLSSRVGWRYMTDSQSFRGYSCGSMAAAYATANMRGEGDSRPSDSWMYYAIGLDELQSLIPDLGQKALLAAQMRIGATSIPAGRYHIAIEQTILMNLLSPLLGALSDYSLYQQRSMLQKANIGDQITSKLLTLTDEPQRHGAFSACLFDAEGVRTSYTPIIQEGKMQTRFISTYFGRKLQMQPTLSSPNVLCIEPGTQTRQEVLDSLNDTILITGFLGGNCNDVTGDFSFGIEGQLYRHGERIQGISGMNLTGNILDLWNHLSHVCSDIERLPDGYFPTLFFENIELC